jgi:hypothetical protein
MEELQKVEPAADTSQDTLTLVDKAIAAANLLKEQNDRKESLLKIEEELTARRILGGVTEAGIPRKVETQDDVITKEVLDMLKGTGLNPFKK